MRSTLFIIILVIISSCRTEDIKPQVEESKFVRYCVNDVVYIKPRSEIEDCKGKECDIYSTSIKSCKVVKE